MEREHEEPGEAHRQQLALRAKAELRRRLVSAATDEQTPEQVRRLVQELQVYQIELEMQYEELRQAQSESEQLRHQYEDLYDFAPVGYCTLGPDGLVQQLNLRAARLLGRERASVVGRRFALHVQLADRAAFHQFLAQVLASDVTQHCEVQLLCADGSLFWARLEGMRLPAAEKGYVCRLILLDDSERHRTQRQLAASEARFRTLFEESQDAVCLVKNGRYVDCNRAALQLLGARDKSQIVGQGIALLTPEFQPDGRRSAQAQAEILDRLHQWGSARVEWLRRRFTGEDLWLELVLTVIDLEEEQLIHVVWRDITARKRADEALAASEARFRTIFEQSADGMLLLQDGRYIAGNRAALAIIGAGHEEQLLGQPASFRMPRVQLDGRDSAEWFAQNVAQAVREGSVRCEALMQRFTGEDIWVEAVLTPVSLPGHPTLTHIGWRDVTERRRAEQLLRESEARLQTAVAAADMGIGSWDLGTRLFSVDQRGRRMFGLPPAGPDLTFDELLALVYPADRGLAAAALEQAAAGTAPLDVEVRLMHPDGRVRYVAANGRLIRGEQGRHTRMSGVLRDVTERRLAEQRLRESEEQLRTALSAANMGVGLWQPSTAKVELDARTAEIMGLAGPGSYAGAELRQRLHPEDSPALLERIRLSLQSRLAFSLHARLRRRPEEDWRYVRISGQGLYDDHGRPNRVAGVVRDITEFRLANLRLRESEERLRLALKSSSTGVFEWSYGSDELFWDERAQLIFGPPADAGRLTFDAIRRRLHPADEAAVTAALARTVKTGEPFELEHRIVWPGGEVRYVAATGQVRYNADGRPERLAGLVRDVTERRLAQEELGYKTRLLNHILTTIPVVLSRVAPDGTLQEVTGPGLRRLGVADNQLVGRNVFESWPQLTAHVQRLLAGEEVQFVGEPPLGGEQVYFQNYGFFDQERQSGVLFAIDVTETHRANARLAADAAFLQGLVSNIQEGIMAFDLELRVTEWNYLMEEFLQAPRAQVLGQPIFEAVPLINTPAHRRLLGRALAGEVLTEYNLPFSARPGAFDLALVPLRDAGGAVVGALGVIRDVTERNRLMEEATQTRLQREKEVLSAIMHTQEDERKRIAEALHNGVGQLLYAAKLHLYNQPVDEQHRTAALGLLNEGIKATRTISFELTPNILEDFGLKTALEELCKRIPKQNLDVHLSVGEMEPALPRLFETAVYRIVQELLNNVIKHAQAREAFVYVEQQGAQLHVSVEDDGRGFDVDSALQKRGGIGLTGIRNRVGLLAGQLTIRSKPGLGTTISIELPLGGEAAGSGG